MGTDQRRAILAVVISGVILFGWQYFFAPPVQVAPQITKSEVNTKTNTTDSNTIIKSDIEKNVDSTKAEKVETEIVVIKTDKVFYEISSDLTVLNAKNSDTDKEFIKIFTKNNNNSLLFNINGSFQKTAFSFTKISDSKFEISNSALNMTGLVFINDLGFLEFNLNSSKPFAYKFSLNEVAEELEGGKFKQFSYLSDDLTLTNVGDDEKGDKELKWFGLDFNYHLFATIIEKKSYIFKMTEAGEFSINTNTAVSSLNYKQIFVKKEYDTLAALGNNLELAVDFGIWSIIAVPILRGLQFFYTILPNWGLSIIILTLIIRTLTFPLQYKSFKSMKKMQEIQPELTKIRERLKDNPQKMQQETMALFKKAGTNPLGGCLPMLLQMPIFFAFYRVLYSSVELVDAPFMLWIVDLSEKDPYYVLPVLMAIAMFFHQRLTPTTTMDPAQKKIMMFMPLIFAVFMKDFPAGLTLYIFVSTVVAMLQQMFVFKRT
jgi:YidC/Oxa1 family membrane protein insertase